MTDRHVQLTVQNTEPAHDAELSTRAENLLRATIGRQQPVHHPRNVQSAEQQAEARWDILKVEALHAHLHQPVQDAELFLKQHGVIPG